MITVESSEIRTENSGLRTAIALLLLSCCIIASLVVPIPMQGRVSSAVGDLAHAPLFGSITFVVLLLLRRRFNRRIPFGIVIAVALSVCTFGVLIELVQSVSGRSPNVRDAVANTLGIITAVVFYYAYSLRQSTPWTSLCLLLFACVILATAWRPPLTVLFDVAKARWEFPVLASFDSEAEFDRFYFQRCEPRLTAENATSGRYAMELTCAADRHPSARLQEFNPDWSRFQSLEMDLILDQSYTRGSLGFTVQVVGRKLGTTNEAYFSQTIDLEPGVPRHIRISRQQLLSGPSERELDLSAIIGIDLIAIEPSVRAKVRVDSIELTLQ